MEEIRYVQQWSNNCETPVWEGVLMEGWYHMEVCVRCFILIILIIPKSARSMVNEKLFSIVYKLYVTVVCQQAHTLSIEWDWPSITESTANSSSCSTIQWHTIHAVILQVMHFADNITYCSCSYWSILYCIYLVVRIYGCTCMNLYMKTSCNCCCISTYFWIRRPNPTINTIHPSIDITVMIEDI